MANLKIPDFGSFDKRKISQSTKIYDRTGKILLYDIHQDIKRRVVPLENISTYIQKATIAIEDSDFYTHNGIKIESIIRAVWVNLTKGGAVQGGSTITQQVIKNTLLTQEKSVTRKITEWILALKLDKVLSKQQILSIYLNESPYGGTVYGVEEATQRFFNKKASDVTLAEAA
ncbi:MAG: biosynthetic peptidoglycan transglycosylase [bacterium]